MKHLSISLDSLPPYIVNIYESFSISISNDILFVIRFVNESVAQPVYELKEIGIIILKSCICFNLDILSMHIFISPKQKILSSLQRDGWHQATSDAFEELKHLIGENLAKNWIIYELPLPNKSDITTYINENPRLHATELSINTQNTPIIPPHKMPSYFPLVSIQYEREKASFSIFDYDSHSAKAEGPIYVHSSGRFISFKFFALSKTCPEIVWTFPS